MYEKVKALMSYEDKVALLGQYISIDQHIDELIGERRRCYERALSITGEIGVRVAGSAECSGVERAVEQMIQLERKINSEIDRLYALRMVISQGICGLTDELHRRIVHLKYVVGLSFEEIAERIGYCSRQISRLHRTAVGLVQFDKVA